VGTLVQLGGNRSVGAFVSICASVGDCTSVEEMLEAACQTVFTYLHLESLQILCLCLDVGPCELSVLVIHRVNSLQVIAVDESAKIKVSSKC